MQLFLPRIIVMYLIAGSAFLFYVTKIPERCFPGESFSSVSFCVQVGSCGVKPSETFGQVNKKEMCYCGYCVTMDKQRWQYIVFSVNCVLLSQ